VVGFSHIFLLGILIVKGLTARRLYKSFGVKGLTYILSSLKIVTVFYSFGVQFSIYFKCRRSQPSGGQMRDLPSLCMLGLQVRVLLEAWRCVCCEHCEVSGRDIWEGPITLPEESYQVWCLSVVFLSVLMKPRQLRGPGQLGAVMP
jgi:hypothetical protein